ncbi:MAG: NADH:ubiquinone reductase (Na(+)-transporting) subunit C [Muribaculum sp.]|nr:NADH:ubiquinone reductase (Na(+)-transporting) subunit C [Muribaculaceae bacterium]MCM1080668.1 NADH:ubiquinone reductase (Na(+)-transporting) subunit C [Muribaculum sp.]
MNKQSNIYTIIYITVLVVIVGAALAITSLSLKPQQTDNANADKMHQILASVHIVAGNTDVKATFNKYVTNQFIVSANGTVTPGDAFNVNVAKEVKLPPDQRRLPLYECTLENGSKKYVIPLAGNGLWGPIWGYLSVDENGTTIYGAYFAHQGETPGLGAEIEKPAFSAQFEGKNLFKNNKFLPIGVLKAGTKPLEGEDYVDAISGGTITSKGVEAMIADCITGYEKFLESIKSKS